MPPVAFQDDYVVEHDTEWFTCIGPTLLQQAVASPECQAFYLASTLLETLLEHQVSCHQLQNVGCQRQCLTVSLEHSVPVTAHQTNVLQLESLLPHNQERDGLAAGHDWLDCDLHHFLQDSHIPLELRTRFANFHSWHDHGTPAPDYVSVYTDGSATGIGEHHPDAVPCSWAFSVWAHSSGKQYLVGYAADQATPTGTPFHLLETTDTALTGEYLALAWGLIWVAEHGCQHCSSFGFYYDALSAGSGVFGTAAIPTGAEYRPIASFCVYLRQYVQTLVRLEHFHVQSHSGQIQNEFVDQLAKQARRRPTDVWDRCLPLWPARLCLHPYASWAWATRPVHPDLPTFYSFESEAYRLQGLTRSSTHAPTQGLQSIALAGGHAAFHFGLITVNVLTLRDVPDKAHSVQPTGLRLPGRKGILKQTLAPHRPLFIGIQETRLQTDSVQPDADYHILQSSATDAGVGGCALWVSKTQPYATCGNSKLYIEANHLTVTSHGFRHLIVTVSAPRLLLQVCVLHAPSLANTPRQTVEDFWDTHAQHICTRPEGADFIILLDANSRVGSVVSPHINDKDFEIETESGALFHDFLVRVDGFLPTTWPEIHTGSSGTWCSPQGDWSRLDYVILPCSWQGATLESRVLTEAEMLQKREDHLPVYVSCSFAKSLPPDSYISTRKKVIRPAPTQRNTPEAQAALTRVPAIDWTVSVDQHCDTLVHAWHNAAAPLCSTDQPRPLQAYLASTTLDIVYHRQALRKYLSQEAGELRRRLSLIAFAAFVLHTQGRRFNPNAVARADFWLRAMDVSEAAAVALLHWYGKQLRVAVANDRRTYLQGLTLSAAQADFRNPRDLYQAIRKAFPAAKASRRSHILPLPILYRADGTVASTTDARAQCWTTHFAAQEGGVVVSAEEYMSHVADMNRRVRQPVFNCGTLPTLCQTEQAIHGLHNNRAAGPDGTTAEVLKVSASHSTRQLMPLIVKTVLSIQEPVSWKGGTLMVLAKKACAKLTCENYRSILISNVPGKVFHRCLRSGLKPYLLASQPALQAGVQEGVGIEVPALAIRSFIALHDGLRRPWGVIFVDLAAAFYSVLRQSLVPNPDTDEGFLSLLHSLQLPDTAVQELHAHLQAAAELPLQGATPHQVEVIRDLFTGSWFRLATHPTIVLTKRGSRPGDPLADILFAFTLSAYLRKAHELLEEAGVLQPLPRPDSRPTWAPCLVDYELGNPAWADDFTWPVSAPSAPDLLRHAATGTSILLSHASSIGMKLKFGVEKTALLLSEAVKRDAASLLDRSSDGNLCLAIQDHSTGNTEDLPIVSAYRHLGGIVTSTSSPVPDLHHRFARADGTARPLRRAFFSSRQFPVAVRRSLLQALVVSKYVHTGAALILRAACHLKLWERHYICLWRNLSRRIAADHQDHPYIVLSRAEAGAPPLALAKARATFLAKVFTKGPAPLAAFLVDHFLLHPSSSWLDQLRADVDFVALYLPSVRAVLPTQREVGCLVEAAQDDPHWWVRTIRKVEKLYLQELQRWQESQAHDSPPEHAASHVTPAEAPFICGTCSKSFVLRKHLHVHLARAHGFLSPSRHYALTEACTACGKFYGSISKVQQHLKCSHKCLKRCSMLHPPLTKCQIARLEAPAEKIAKSIKAGTWRAFVGSAPPAPAHTIAGPLLPTAAERLCGLAPDEDALLSDLGRHYVPTPAITDWIDEYIAGKSVEGLGRTFWTCQRWAKSRAASTVL
ncbi:tyrP-A [Symbiodinium sp. CCMP2592]|nr:tyrP-A [Symbiodinium sp. CCMP2592]